MLALICTVLITYVYSTFLGYCVHWAIHQPWAGLFYKAHMIHHLELYPNTRLVSDKYLSAGSKSTVYTFVVAFTPFFLIPILTFCYDITTLAQSISILLVMGFVGFVNDFIHDSYHVKNHWLNMVIPHYSRLRKLHFIHHLNMNKNFGIYGFYYDKLFNTHKN